MKIYQIKREDALILKGLSGLYHVPLSSHYAKILVIDSPALSNFGACHDVSILPKNCNTKLVCAFLGKMQSGVTTSESVKILKEYLQYAEKKDKNDEIKADLKQAIKDVFYGLFLVVGSVTGFMLMLLLIGMAAAYTGWISLLILPIVAVAAYGIINTLVGVLKFGFGIFSFGFRQNNTEKRLELENVLYRFCLQPSLPLPSYQEVVDNAPPTAPVLHSEPPTYQEAVENAAKLSMHHRTPPINIPRLASLAHHSPHFFHDHLHPSVSNCGVVNDALPPVYFY